MSDPNTAAVRLLELSGKALDAPWNTGAAPAKQGYHGRPTSRRRDVMHPLAGPAAANSGAFDMRAGDRVSYRGRTGIADEFLSDGEALITWDDGTFGIVKWNHLLPDRDFEMLCQIAKAVQGSSYEGVTVGEMRLMRAAFAAGKRPAVQAGEAEKTDG